MSLFKSTTIFLVLFFIYGIRGTSDFCNSDFSNEGKDGENELHQLNIRFRLGTWQLMILQVCVPENVYEFIKENLIHSLDETDPTKSQDDLRYNGQLRTSEKGITEEEKGQRAKENSLSYLLRRQWNVRPLTEVGPGEFKHDIENYPPGALAKEMKKLLALKKRQEDRARDLNEGSGN